jgi:hypothetical protein
MELGEKNRQLIRIAAVIDGLFLLLCVLLVFFMSSDNSDIQRYFRKMAAFAIANIVCWPINIFLILFIIPVVNKGKQERGILFYLLSFVISMSVVQLLPSFVMEGLHLNPPHIRFSPLVYAAIFNAMETVIQDA